MNKKVAQNRQNVKPPYCNTGAVNTKGLKSLIDWVSFTLPDSEFHSLSDIYGFLDIPEKEWVDAKHGNHGYMSQKLCGHINLLYNGMEGMGYHISISGQGCRELEQRKGLLWSELFKKIIDKGSFTRLDIAIDDHDGHFKIDQLKEKVKRGECISKFIKARGIEEFNLKSGDTDGQTLYFGRPTSRLQIRIYDKAKEQGIDGIWNRTEIQARDERATVMASNILESDNVGVVVLGILKTYIKFAEPISDSNKSRWPVSEFWIKFLGVVEKVKLTIKKPDKSIRESIEWANKQWAPTAALLMRYFKGDLSFFDDLIADGEERLKPRHLALL